MRLSARKAELRLTQIPEIYGLHPNGPQRYSYYWECSPSQQLLEKGGRIKLAVERIKGVVFSLSGVQNTAALSVWTGRQPP